VVHFFRSFTLPLAAVTMCQVTPFTYPCCRRIYVLVEKLPNCPADWPRSKCPQELCIQVIDTETAEPKHSSTGVCWRCTAAADGKTGADRESLRPEIDKAVIVEGLEELDVSERKQRAEDNGSCWYCGSRQACSNFGTNKSNKSEPAPDGSSPIPLSKKRQVGDARRPRKKSKGDGGMGRPSHLRTLPPIGGLSQAAFNVPGQISRAAQFLPQRKPRGTPFGFQNQNISPLPPISEVSAGMWQHAIPSTGSAPTAGYTPFWQNFNNNTLGPSSAAGGIQAPQNMNYQMGLDYHSPGTGMELDSGSGGYNPVGLSQQNTLSKCVLTVYRWLWTISPILIILPCLP
jgi:hypothetical protein